MQHKVRKCASLQLWTEFRSWTEWLSKKPPAWCRSYQALASQPAPPASVKIAPKEVQSLFLSMEDIRAGFIYRVDFLFEGCLLYKKTASAQLCRRIRIFSITFLAGQPQLMFKTISVFKTSGFKKLGYWSHSDYPYNVLFHFRARSFKSVQAVSSWKLQPLE